MHCFVDLSRFSSGLPVGRPGFWIKQRECVGQENVDLCVRCPTRLHGAVLSQSSTGTALASWCRVPNGAHNQILISLFDSYLTGRQTVGRNVTWNWTCVIALQITDPSSRQRGRPTWKIKQVIATQINVTSGHLLQDRQDTKTNWPTDCRSQCDFYFDCSLLLVR
jgi:hypothetical protein